LENLQNKTIICILLFSGDHDSSLRGESPPKWSHLNVLSAAAAVASAAGGNPLKQHCINENANGSPLSESPLHHNYHHHHHALAHQQQQQQQQHHSHGHLGLQTSVHSQSPSSHHSHTTISSQFSALLGASSGYLLSSESKTMPIF
jgi:hypothetical protein